MCVCVCVCDKNKWKKRLIYTDNGFSNDICSLFKKNFFGMKMGLSKVQQLKK